MQDYSPPPGLLAERVILVTGAGSGIGRAAARSFASYGATVVLLGPIQRQLEAVYDEIETAGDPTPAIVLMDLEKAADADYPGLAASLDQAFGRLDGLLHNAAVLPFLSRLDDYDPAAWHQVLRINLTAPMLLTQACLPLLRRSSDASILFTSDRVGRRGKAYWGAYGVSKFALEGLMQILADELRGSSAIRVNSIDPGPVRTDLRIKVYPGVDPSQWPAPDDILAAYLYLMGPDGKDINGQACDAQ
jgi:NAD(P)-dependent dehydrogenase (short-subunit alcohol dehydrogenase family)